MSLSCSSRSADVTSVGVNRGPEPSAAALPLAGFLAVCLRGFFLGSSSLLSPAAVEFFRLRLAAAFAPFSAFSAFSFFPFAVDLTPALVVLPPTPSSAAGVAAAAAAAFACCADACPRGFSDAQKVETPQNSLSSRHKMQAKPDNT